jgi:hypothetical protein
MLMFPAHRSGWGFIVAGVTKAEASLSMASQRPTHPSQLRRGVISLAPSQEIL